MRCGWKYVDDSNISETVQKGEVSHIQLTQVQSRKVRVE